MNMHSANMLSWTCMPCKDKEVDNLESRNDRSLRFIREYSRRMTRRQERCLSIGAPLLEHERRAHGTRWAGLQKHSVVIPRSHRADMKMKVYLSHLGTEVCLRSAIECIY